MMDMFIGRKEILNALRVSDWGTVRNWKRNYKLPIRYLPNNKPMLMLSEMKKWMIYYSDLKSNQSEV
jgi:hypothetical protein